MQYGISKTVDLSFDDAITRITDELRKEGFGVLTTIDVRETFKKKLDVDFPRYVILGACNPPFAYKALLVDDQIGLLLPCNVVVQEKEGRTVIAAFDPLIMADIISDARMAPIADEVRKRLQRVIDSVQ